MEQGRCDNKMPGSSDDDYVRRPAGVAVIVLVRWLGDSGRSGPLLRSSDRSPADILKERFARGEIDKEGFDEGRRILEK